MGNGDLAIEAAVHSPHSPSCSFAAFPEQLPQAIGIHIGGGRNRGAARNTFCRAFEQTAGRREHPCSKQLLHLASDGRIALSPLERGCLLGALCQVEQLVKQPAEDGLTCGVGEAH
jgi:hypothetical protein